MEKKRWTEEEEIKIKQLLLSGLTCKEVAAVTGRSDCSISKQNSRKWKINLSDIFYNEKLSRNVLKVSHKISESMKKKGKWAGENNPNYAAKIVKRGKDNPLSIWKSQNPGFQDGEKNPSFGRIIPPEEIEKKTAKIREFNKARKGKTYKEVYGEKKAAEISKILSKSCALRMSKQKSSGTKPELEIKEKLDALKIAYEFQYPIDYYCVDFYLPVEKAVIQVDGCYWHGHGCSKYFKELNKQQKNQIRLDHSCNSYLRNKGYKVIRIWECEIPTTNIEFKIESITKETLCP